MPIISTIAAPAPGLEQPSKAASTSVGVSVEGPLQESVYAVGNSLKSICSMPDLSTYTDNPPNAFAMSFIRALEAEGFTVAPTVQGPKGQRKTLRITWRNVYIGQMSEGLWGRKIPYACLYRFTKDGKLTLVNHAPQDFDKDAFARQHGCDPDLLHVKRDYSGSYLWVQDEATSLLLMQDWARRIDEV